MASSAGLRAIAAVAVLTSALALARDAHADPDPPLTIGFLDVPAMILDVGSLVSATVTVVYSSNEERVPTEWGAAAGLFGAGSCITGIILSLDAHDFSRDVGITSIGVCAVDLGLLFWNARYAPRLPNQVSELHVGPRVFTDVAGNRVYGGGITLGSF